MTRFTVTRWARVGRAVAVGHANYMSRAITP